MRARSAWMTAAAVAMAVLLLAGCGSGVKASGARGLVAAVPTTQTVPPIDASSDSSDMAIIDGQSAPSAQGSPGTGTALPSAPLDAPSLEGAPEDDPPVRRKANMLASAPGGTGIVNGCEIKRYAVCKGADLRGVDLSGADLSGADLSHANLAGVQLVRAVLASTDLRYSDLTGADFSGAYMVSAKLNGSTLKGATLSQANLFNARLNVADLTGANLTKAHLGLALFLYADLTGANLTGVSTREALLSSANLSRAIWSDGHICAEGSVGTCR